MLIGCTNFKSNRTGCNNTISKTDYYKMNNLSPEPAPKKEIPKGYNPVKK